MVGPSTTLRSAVKKTSLGHCVLFPSYTAAFYVYMALLEGSGVREGVDKLIDRAWPTFWGGTAFWPAANIINFMYVPIQYRVLYLNAGKRRVHDDWG